MRSARFRLMTAALALAAPFLLAGCGDDAGSGAAAAAHNDADVTFAQGMIPHHAQAVQMAKMAATQASSAEVKTLAAAIEGAQQPEIDTMSGWLRSWGEDVPGTDAHSGHDMSADDHAAGGMMTEAQMVELARARGAEWDRMFLNGMIVHHEGAVAMAQKELDEGRATEAKALAQRILDAQKAEIEQMRALLKTLG